MNSVLRSILPLEDFIYGNGYKIAKLMRYAPSSL